MTGTGCPQKNGDKVVCLMVIRIKRTIFGKQTTHPDASVIYTKRKGGCPQYKINFYTFHMSENDTQTILVQTIFWYTLYEL